MDMVRRHRHQWIGVVLSLLLGLLLFSVPLNAAPAFASPLFQTKWQEGEVITPNFWGPIANATDGIQESYAEAIGHKRLVQYFDKARMELTDPSTGVVTNGLLATELITGRRQFGDNTFEQAPPAEVPIAGDPTNTGPTYAQIGLSGLRTDAASAIGEPIMMVLSATGTTSTFAKASSDANATITTYDTLTKHNVPKSFTDYRTNAGLLTIGLAIAEPFWSNVVVGGQSRDVLIQAFERRVLTYTPSNPEAFKVEMGNIGQHYYAWRYRSTAPISSNSTATAPSPAPSSPSATSGTTLVPSATAIPGSSALTVTFVGTPTTVATGDIVTADVTTRSGASCTLTLRAPGAKDAARTTSFGTKLAGSDGRVSWSSALPLDTAVGTWPLEAKCESGGQSGTASTTIAIQAGSGGA